MVSDKLDKGELLGRKEILIEHFPLLIRKEGWCIQFCR